MLKLRLQLKSRTVATNHKLINFLCIYKNVTNTCINSKCVVNERNTLDAGNIAFGWQVVTYVQNRKNCNVLISFTAMSYVSTIMLKRLSKCSLCLVRLMS